MSMIIFLGRTMYEQTYTCMHKCMHMHLLALAHTHTHTYTHTHTQIHTQTHTFTQTLTGTHTQKITLNLANNLREVHALILNMTRVQGLLQVNETNISFPRIHKITVFSANVLESLVHRTCTEKTRVCFKTHLYLLITLLRVVNEAMRL